MSRAMPGAPRVAGEPLEGRGVQQGDAMPARRLAERTGGDQCTQAGGSPSPPSPCTTGPVRPCDCISSHVPRRDGRKLGLQLRSRVLPVHPGAVRGTPAVDRAESSLELGLIPVWRRLARQHRIKVSKSGGLEPLYGRVHLKHLGRSRAWACCSNRVSRCVRARLMRRAPGHGRAASCVLLPDRPGGRSRAPVAQPGPQSGRPARHPSGLQRGPVVDGGALYRPANSPTPRRGVHPQPGVPLPAAPAVREIQEGHDLSPHCGGETLR